MAKAKVNKKVTTAIDLTLYWSTLNYFPPELKNQLWMAQALFYAKKNGVQFLDSKKCAKYRALDNLEIDKQAYINMIDPPTPQGSGGEAEYFSADFKANPIDVHLDNIVKADILEKIPQQLTVNVTDPIAKTQKQKDNDRVIYQREVRQVINHVWEQLGIKPLTGSQDPYQYIKGMQSQVGGEGENEGNENGSDAQSVNALPDVVNYIRNEIRDSEDLMLYDQYIYKCDIEKAFELGIQHYMINQNKWKDEKGEHFLNDLKNFNKACGRKYIDKTTGRPTILYISPDNLFTSKFKWRNGEDVTFFFYEEPYAFSDFVRMFGAGLDETQLREIFALNKQQVPGSAAHGIDTEGHLWNDLKGTPLVSNALIMVGFFSILTQDTEVFADGYVNNQYIFQRKDIDWSPQEKEEGLKREQRTYNVWYSCYYIPPPSGQLTNVSQQAAWQWQAKYIFEMEKDIDQMRYGEDLRYAKPTLVIWRDIRPSFTDIKQAYMPKINTLWHKFQNCLIQDTVGLAMADDLLGALLNSGIRMVILS